MSDRPLYKTHWLFGLTKWDEAKQQYMRVKKGSFASSEVDAQREADRLNSQSQTPYPAWVQLVPGEF